MPDSFQEALAKARGKAPPTFGEALAASRSASSTPASAPATEPAPTYVHPDSWKDDPERWAGLERFGGALPSAEEDPAPDPAHVPDFDPEAVSWRAREFLRQDAASPKGQPGELERALSGTARVLASPFRGASAGFLDESKLVPESERARYLKTAESRINEAGFLARAGNITGETGGAFLPIGKVAQVGRAVGLGRAAGVTALGAYSGASEAVRGGDLKSIALATAQGLGFGVLAGLSGPALERALRALPHDAKSKLLAAIREKVIQGTAGAASMVAAGQAMHGPDLSNVDVDAALGVAFGVFGHRPVSRLMAGEPPLGPERARAAEGALKRGVDPIQEVNALRLGRTAPEAAPPPPPVLPRRDERDPVVGERAPVPEGKAPLTLAEAGEIKARAVADGKAVPDEVYSPERVRAAEAAVKSGGDAITEVAAVGLGRKALEAMPPERRPDGSIAAGYKPTEQALREGLIEPAAEPLVREAQAQGIETVSSGVTEGKPFAIGRAPSGETVRLEASEAAGVERGLSILRGKPERLPGGERGAFSPGAVVEGALGLAGLPRKAVELASHADRAVVNVARKVGAALGVRPGGLGQGQALRETIHQHRGERGAIQQRARYAAQDLAIDDAGKRLTPQQQEAAFQYLTGAGNRTAVEQAIGRKYADTADKYRAAVDANQAELLRLGHLSPQTYQAWIGKWLPRRFTTIEEAKAESMGGKSGVAPGRLHQRKNLTPAQLQALGEIRDPAVAVAHGLAIQDSAISSLRVLDALSKDARHASAAPQGKGWQQIANDKARYGALAGMHVRDNVAREIKGFVGGDKDGGPWRRAGEITDALLGEWKLASTALNPATHVRNMAGNLIFKELDHYSALDPSNLVHAKDALKVIYAGNESPLRDLRLKALKERLIHADFLSTDVLEIAKAVEKTAGVTWREKVQNYVATKGEALKGAHVVQALPGTEIATKLYGLEDTLTKVGSWVKKMKGGMTPEDAGKAVREAYPTFGEGHVPRLMRRAGPIGRQVLPPFASFTEQAARIFTTAAMHKPVTSAIVASAIIEGLDLLGGNVSDEEREQMREVLPPWLRPGLSRPAVKAVDEKGVFRIAELSGTIPLANEAESPVSGVSPGPLAKAIIEWATEKKWHPGLNADDEVSLTRDYIPDNASQGERDRAKKKTLLEGLLPSVPFLPGSRSFNRVAEAKPEDKDLARLSKWGGVTLKDVDTVEERRKTVTRLVMEQRAARKRLGSIARGDKSAEDKAEETAEVLAEIEDRAKRLKRIEGVGLGKKPK